MLKLAVRVNSRLALDHHYLRHSNVIIHIDYTYMFYTYWVYMDSHIRIDYMQTYSCWNSLYAYMVALPLIIIICVIQI